jgi:hypothetical protein
MFYIGLKDYIKDKLAIEDEDKDLVELVALAIRINNRIYERKLKKRGNYNY